MLTAKKGNKVVQIAESSKEHYLNDGFTVYKDGKPIAFGKGVGVSMTEYQRLLDENERLKERIQELELAKTEVGTEAVKKPKAKKK